MITLSWFRPLVAALGLLATVLAAGSASAQTAPGPRILAIGDSMLAAHSISGRGVSDFLAAELGAPVTDRSVAGAWMIYNLPISGALGLSIPKQFRGTNWDWVVVNGGGNDLWLGCGCHRCERKLDKLISETGTKGALPRLFSRILRTGARVVYVGYLRSPGVFTPIEDCRDEGDTLEARVADLAARVEGLYYVSLQDLVPYGDRSFHAIDGIHPSLKGSREIAAQVARVMRTASR